MSQPHPRIDAPTRPTDLEEERELRAVAALLRGLPDPEPPSDLADRVLARIGRYEARPRVVRRLLEFAPRPALATALAAGIGGLLVLGSIQNGWRSPQPLEAAPLEPMVARRVSDATVVDTDALRPRRPVVPSFVSAAVIDGPPAGFLAAPPISLSPPAAVVADTPTSPLDQRLDRQLNHLLLDPASFYQRLDRVHDADRFIGRLAERAARRGDAADIALELRQRLPRHAHTAVLMERMLGAVLAQQAPNR